MKNALLILFLMSIVLVSCTQETFEVIGAVLPEPEVENNPLFDANCVPGDIVLDSFYLDATTREMLPYDHTSRLVFKSESGESVMLHKREEAPTYRRKVVEKFCVNADNEWSVGSEVSEYLRIVYEGVLPSGDEISIYGFMRKEKTWFTDKTIETGYYDDFQVYVSVVAPNSATYHQSTIRCTTWFDDNTVAVEDTDLQYVDENLVRLNLNGEEFENVLIGGEDPHDSELKIYVQKNEGVIGFLSKTGDLFVIE